MALVQVEGYQEWHVTLAGIGAFEAEVVLLSAHPVLGRRLISRLGVFLDHGERVVVEQ